MALGANEVTPLQMAQAYAVEMMADNGVLKMMMANSLDLSHYVKG
jgi:membrane carboxypeptidase/penicillin-binding protein